MVGRQPAVEHLIDLNESVTDLETDGRILAAITRITLNGDRKWISHIVRLILPWVPEVTGKHFASRVLDKGGPRGT